MPKIRIFIVEDDPFYGELLKYHLSQNPDFEPVLLGSAKECIAHLSSQPDIICLDFGLPDMKGDKLLKIIKTHNINTPVIVISGQEQINVAVGLLKAGARDYIIKDENTKDLLWKSILNIKETLDLKQEVQELKSQLQSKYDFQKMILGHSPEIKSVFKLVEKATRTNINISITGETGTGKELVAKAVHFSSDGKKKPFVAVNMGAIPKDLLESELFGFEKGAFTGAINEKRGKFEEAQGGTLFLDEIGELDLNMQSKILRALQEREIVRIGSNKKIALNIRLVTATHRDLAEEVKKGNFREDLFYRLVGLPIKLPPLRDRKSDILILAKHFLQEFVKENSLIITDFAEGAKNKLLSYDYPGNVRELKSVVELACVMSDSPMIVAGDINFIKLGDTKAYSSEEKTMREYTCEIIQLFLNRYNGNVLKVASKLDIGKSTIYKMLKDKEIKI